MDGLLICPFVPGKLRPETEAVLRPLRASFVDVSASDDAYSYLLRELWAEGETFVICEHDMLPTDAAIAGLARCPEPWCGCKYWVSAGANLNIALGCTKFSASLMARYPEFMDEVGSRTDGSVPAGSWQRLDFWVCIGLYERGVEPCEHEEVLHLNPACVWRTDGRGRDAFTGRYRWIGGGRVTLPEIGVALNCGEEFDWPCELNHSQLEPVAI